jgi:Transposase DDE domain group 1
VSDDTTTDGLIFPECFSKRVAVRFDQDRGSSDGGALLLKVADERLGLTRGLAGCIEDGREPGKIKHDLVEILSQRVFGIACGYPDGNDAGRLGEDPIQRMLVGRDPVEGDPLASQPTLSRFENAVGRKDLYRMGEALAELVIEHHRQRLRGRAKTITIDLDPTDDPTHGAQQLSFFNGHYDSWCYLPVVGFLTFDRETDPCLFTAVLRPGNAPAKLGALGILRRTLARLREAFPRVRFRVRLDGGFACPEIFDFFDSQKDVDYVVAMGKNPVLERKAKRLMGRARRLSREAGQTEHVFGECRYAAKTWKDHKRRVIIKAEVVRHPGREPKDNPRFVVTNLSQTPQWIYKKVYCGRGEIENRIKELHHGLEMDRTSCSRFWANQLRVTLTAAAYVLMQEIRRKAARTAFARAQVSTLREHLFKIGAHVTVSVRRILVQLPACFPNLEAWNSIALAFGARSG